MIFFWGGVSNKKKRICGIDLKEREKPLDYLSGINVLIHNEDYLIVLCVCLFPHAVC